MSDSPTDIEVTLLLCDAAQSIGGKLYILGGGWSAVAVPQDSAFPMALAFRITVPWTEANRKIPVRVFLHTHDGEPVDVGDGPIENLSEVEVGRPPGLEPGTPLDAMFAVNAGAVSLPAGRYVWQVEVDGAVKAKARFRVQHVPSVA